MAEIKRKSIHCSDSESLSGNSGFSHELLQLRPGAICFFAEEDDFVLSLVEIETETGFDGAFTGTVVSGSNVIYVDQKSATLGMSEVDVFNQCGHLSKSVWNKPNQSAAGYSG
jgi:hypothetical protein